MENQIRKNEKLSVVEIGSEIGLMHIETGKYYVLNEVGTAIWRLLEETTTSEELVNKLMQEYEVDEAQCRESVKTFLADLVAKNMVTLEQ